MSLPTHSCDNLRSKQLLFAVFTVFWIGLIGCSRSSPVTDKNSRSTTKSDVEINHQLKQSAGRIAEAKVFVHNGSMTFLALVHQKHVGPYVTGIVKSTDNLGYVVAVLQKTRKVSPEKQTVAWLQENLTIRELEGGVIAIGVANHDGLISESVDIVNTTARCFCEREPTRVASEIEVLMDVARQKQQSNDHNDAERSLRILEKVAVSERFKELPRILELAAE